MPYIPSTMRPSFLTVAEEFVRGCPAERVCDRSSALIQAVLERIYCAEIRYFKLNEAQGLLDCQLMEWCFRADVRYEWNRDCVKLPPAPVVSELMPDEAAFVASFTERLTALVPIDDQTVRAGCLNFFITELFIEIVSHLGLSKTALADLALAVKTRWYERIAVPYEIRAAEKNGDCRFDLVKSAD